MAHLQSAARVYALEALRPAVVLERMNGFVVEGERGGMLTLLYAILDPSAGTLRIASAGHPPPLVLRPDQEPAFAESPPSSPLGVTRFPVYEESVMTLHPEATVLFYTDGLVETPKLPLTEDRSGCVTPPRTAGSSRRAFARPSWGRLVLALTTISPSWPSTSHRR